MKKEPSESMHDRALRESGERARAREKLAADRLSEGAKVAQQMLGELVLKYSVFQPERDLPRIQEDARDWLQRKYPDAQVPPLVGRVEVARVGFPKLPEIIAKLIGEQEGDLFSFLAPPEAPVFTDVCLRCGSPRDSKCKPTCPDNEGSGEGSQETAVAGIAAALAAAKDPAAVARALRSAILAGLALASKGGVLLRGRDVRLLPPAPGFVVSERWAIGGDRDTDTWYPTEAAAQAHLEALATEHRRTVSGRSVDLTADGCNESSAFYREVTA